MEKSITRSMTDLSVMPILSTSVNSQLSVADMLKLKINWDGKYIPGKSTCLELDEYNYHKRKRTQNKFNDDCDIYFSHVRNIFKCEKCGKVECCGGMGEISVCGECYETLFDNGDLIFSYDPEPCQHYDYEYNSDYILDCAWECGFGDKTCVTETCKINEEQSKKLRKCVHCGDCDCDGNCGMYYGVGIPPEPCDCCMRQNCICD